MCLKTEEPQEDQRWDCRSQGPPTSSQQSTKQNNTVVAKGFPSDVCRCFFDNAYTSVSQTFSMEEPLRYIFTSRGTPTYKKVYRPQKADSGERKSITARLLSGKFYVKICYIYIYIPRFLEEPLTIFCGTPGFLGTLVGKHWRIH
jgi:hypothetical protein